ncbi:MAG: hypothetical protein H6701_02940 [Myxococcales bacterium]|nr:hypothetical protein [Myxococcales bacterium]
MAADWTLKVEDFGRIAAAEVTVKPLTVLVGRNNSGKSYLATLIWGLHHGQLETFGEDIGCGAIIDGWLKRAEASGNEWTAWTEDEQHALQTAWPRFVDASIGDFCRRLFDTDGIRPAKVSVEAPGFARAWYAKRIGRLAYFSTNAEMASSTSAIVECIDARAVHPIGRRPWIVGVGDSDGLMTGFERRGFYPGTRHLRYSCQRHALDFRCSCPPIYSRASPNSTSVSCNPSVALTA